MLMFTPSSSQAKPASTLRPRSTLLEALPEPRGLFTAARAGLVSLAEALGQPPEDRWKTRWKRSCSPLPLDD